ncbi:hypothetical protein [Treponema lecithinolyticum]|uniref:hypothetical protein n=1 Tax=Treponema lecithinolyticum TaxID=53418 RepID=UPI0028E205F6|nr:hypothetical protein [Treponema lecithinolyticum]
MRIKTASVLFCAAMSVFLILAGCASKKNAEPEARELSGTVKTEVLEHKGSALGIDELPVWVQTYIQKGITGLEKLNDYKNVYCFVAETTASNVDAGQAWVNGFNMPQTIARTVSTRVDALFSGASSGGTDGSYATYFENVVKTASNIEYSGARKINNWWVLLRRYEPNSKTKYADEYRVYVFYTIDRDSLDRQVLSVIDKVAADLKTGADQQAMVNKVKALINQNGL